MQLRQAEALGLLDHHDGGVGHVDADFDHGGGDQDLDLAALEVSITASFSAWRQFAVQQADGDVGKHDLRKMLVHLLRGLHGLGFRFFNDRIDDVGLAPCVDLLA